MAAWERVRASSSEPVSHGRNVAMCLAAVATVALLGSTLNESASDALLQTSIPMASPVAAGQRVGQFVHAQAVPVGQMPRATAVAQQPPRQAQARQQMVQAQTAPVSPQPQAAVPQQQLRPLQAAAPQQQQVRQPMAQPQFQPSAAPQQQAQPQQQVQYAAQVPQAQPRLQPQLVTKNAAIANGQAFPAARPQLDEEEAEEEEAAEEAPAEEAPAEGEEAAAPAGEEGEEAAPAEGGQMGEVECFAAQKCLGTYNQDKVSAEGISDPLLSLQAQCSALTGVVHCMCAQCETTAEEDPQFLALHTEACSPAKIAEYHLAGGACEGFASAYCGLELNEQFCENFAVPPVLGSESWLKQHEVVDPGEEAAAAGQHLFMNQLPRYTEEVADSMDKYLPNGAEEASAKARLADAVADEIEALKPEGDEEEGGAEPEGGQEEAGDEAEAEGEEGDKKKDDEGILCEYTGVMC